jgi:ADP-heptose:LPS heptosyltransferase
MNAAHCFEALMRILAFIPGGIAEQLLFFPTLSALATAYPGSKIDVVVEPMAIAAYQVSQVVTEKITFDFAARNSLADWGNLLGIVRDREYEIAIAPKPSWSLGFLLWLSGIPTRLTYADQPGANFYTATTAPLPADTYAPIGYHHLLRGLNQAGDCPALQVNLPKAAVDWADGERQRLGLANGGYVAMYSRDAGYPANSWEIILQDFQKKQPDLPVVWLQNRQNPDLTAALADRISNLKRSQPIGLGQTIALLAGANLVLSGEGEVLQAAIAAQTFTLGLFGGTNPATRMPATDRAIGIKSPTGKLADIAPATVLETIWSGGQSQ